MNKNLWGIKEIKQEYKTQVKEKELKSTFRGCEHKIYISALLGRSVNRQRRRFLIGQSIFF
jgi:hypothetical protein